MHVGTSGYIAPEGHGWFGGNNPKVGYSVTVDIWSLGVISMELLLGRQPFPNMADFCGYISGSMPLRFDQDSGIQLSETCRDFVRGLLAADPKSRPRAPETLCHTWLRPRDNELQEEVDDS